MKKLILGLNIASLIYVISNLSKVITSTTTFTNYGFVLFFGAVAMVITTGNYLIDNAIYE